MRSSGCSGEDSRDREVGEVRALRTVVAGMLEKSGCSGEDIGRLEKVGLLSWRTAVAGLMEKVELLW